MVAEDVFQLNRFNTAVRERVTQAKALITKTKEIVPEDEISAGPRTVTQVHIIRHGETQGYSTESGLTPLGSWHAHRRGFDISKGVREGERIRIVCAETNRARQTAEQIRESHNAGRYPRNFDACWRYGICPYFAVCTNEASIEDPTLYRKLESVHPELDG